MAHETARNLTQIELLEPLPDGGLIIRSESGDEIFIASDFDFPGIATTFGWPGCPCGSRGTDGTIDCPDCGRTASTLLRRAARWIDDNWGLIVEDPGYFTDKEEAYL